MRCAKTVAWELSIHLIRKIAKTYHVIDVTRSLSFLTLGLTFDFQFSSFEGKIEVHFVIIKPLVSPGRC